MVFYCYHTKSSIFTYKLVISFFILIAFFSWSVFKLKTNVWFNLNMFYWYSNELGHRHSPCKPSPKQPFSKCVIIPKIWLYEKKNLIFLVQWYIFFKSQKFGFFLSKICLGCIRTEKNYSCGFNSFINLHIKSRKSKVCN